MSTRTHFSFRVDIWDSDGENPLSILLALQTSAWRLRRMKLRCSRSPATRSRCDTKLGSCGKIGSSHRGHPEQRRILVR